MTKARIYRVKETVHTEVDGKPVTVHRGELIDADDALYKIIAPFCEAVDEHLRSSAPVEEATAEPGKKRGA